MATGGKVKLDFSGSALPLRFQFLKDTVQVINLSGLSGTADILGQGQSVVLKNYDSSNVTIVTGRNSNVLRVGSEADFKGNIVLTRGVQWAKTLPIVGFPVPQGIPVQYTLDTSFSAGPFRPAVVDLDGTRLQGSLDWKTSLSLENGQEIVSSFLSDWFSLQPRKILSANVQPDTLAGISNIAALGRGLAVRELRQWDAATNTPDIESQSHVNGDYHVIGNPGTQTLGTLQDQDWQVNDIAVYNSALEGGWYRIPSASTVSGYYDARVANVTYGAGINIVSGDNTNNTFSGRPLRAGLNLLSGGLGADTYKFQNLWGFAAISEAPDVSIGGVELPESIDTLDFSGFQGDIQVDVYNFGVIKDTLGQLFPGMEAFAETGFDINTNFVLVRDQALPAAINELFPDADSTSVVGKVIQWIKDIGFGRVYAMDIESLVGPGNGNMTVVMHDSANLRGTVTGKNVTLDYSNYHEGVVVDSDDGFSINFPSVTETFGIDAVDLGGDEGGLLDNLLSGNILSFYDTDRPDNTFAWGSATGIQGNRLGGLTTLADFGEGNVVSQTLERFAVTGLTRVIGSPFADTFYGSRRRVEWVFDASLQDSLVKGSQDADTIYEDSIDLFEPALIGNFIVDLSQDTLSRVGETTTATIGSVNRVISGYGDDLITLDPNDETTWVSFQVDADGNSWGHDTIVGDATGRRVILDFTRLPTDWADPISTQETDPDGSVYKRLTFPGHPEASVRVLLESTTPGFVGAPSYLTKTRSTAWFNLGLFGVKTDEISLDSIVSADTPAITELGEVPAPVLDAAMLAYDGKQLTIERLNGSTLELTLSVVDSVDENDVVIGKEIRADNGEIILLPTDLIFVLADLPDRQLSSRTLRWRNHP